MGEMQGWKMSDGKRKPPVVRPKSGALAHSKKRSRREADLDEEGEERSRRRRRNPGRAARPGHLMDGSSRPCTPDSGFGSIFSSPGVSNL